MAEPRGMISRWLDLLSNFDCEFQFRPGHLHGNADALSRTAHAKLEEDDPDDDDACRITNMEIDESFLKDSELLHAQRADTVISTVRAWILNDIIPPTHKQMKRLNPHIREYKKLLPSLFINTHGLLCIRNKDQCDQVCLPQEMATEVTNHIHATVADHKGVDETLRRVRQIFHFHRMPDLTRAVVQACVTCLAKTGPKRPQRHTLAHPKLEEDYPDDDDACRIINMEIDESFLKDSELLHAQRADTVISTVSAWILNDIVPPTHANK